MRILQLVQRPQRRGAEVFTALLSAALRRQHNDVKTVYLYANQTGASLPLAEGDEIVGANERSLLERLGVHPAALLALATIVRRYSPDVVQANGGRTVKYGAALRVCRALGGAPLIYRNIGNPSDWLSGGRRAFYRRVVMPQVMGVVGVSQATLDGVRSAYRTAAPMCVIPTGVDVASLAPRASRAQVRAERSVSSDAPVLISVGALSREKRLDRLLRVFARVSATLPAARLWVVGAGPLGPELAAQAHALGLAESIVWFGSVDDVATTLAAADLFVLTSDTEGVPSVVLEAGALGLATVATRVGGLPECVRDGETGYLVERDDESGLAQRCIELLADPVRRARFGERARVRVTNDFDIDAIATRFVSFYERVTAA